MRGGALALALLSCGAPARPEPGCPPSVVPVTVAADGGVEVLASGSTLDVVAGPQGGFHVLVGAQVEGVERSGTLEWRLSVDGGLVASRSLKVAELNLEDAGCGWLRRRDLLIFERNEDALQARGGTGLLEAGLVGLRVERMVELR